MASCPILSYSAPTSMTLQLLACLARVLLLAACSRESPTRSSREITERPVVLFCPVVLQLAWRFNFWHAWHVCCFWRLEAASHPWDPVASLCFLAHYWAFQHSISLTTLTTISLKYRVTKCWNTSKFDME